LPPIALCSMSLAALPNAILVCGIIYSLEFLICGSIYWFLLAKSHWILLETVFTMSQQLQKNHNLDLKDKCKLLDHSRTKASQCPSWSGWGKNPSLVCTLLSPKSTKFGLRQQKSATHANESSHLKRPMARRWVLAQESSSNDCRKAKHFGFQCFH